VHKATKKQGGSANMILKLIQKFYKIEERKQTRLEKSGSILNEIKAWLDANQNKYPPQGLMGKAVAHARNQWESWSGYVGTTKLVS
jgi:hypothetical protein